MKSAIGDIAVGDSSNIPSGGYFFFFSDTVSLAGIRAAFGGVALHAAYNLQIGGFLGWDFGFGSDGAKWNFHGRPWIGLGFGYSLSGFWKS